MTDDRQSDPLRDMERRIDRLAARVDLTDQQVSSDLYGLKQDVRDIRSRLAAEFVTRLEFDPVKKLTMGAAALILVAVLSAVVASVVAPVSGRRARATVWVAWLLLGIAVCIPVYVFRPVPTVWLESDEPVRIGPEVVHPGATLRWVRPRAVLLPRHHCAHVAADIRHAA